MTKTKRKRETGLSSQPWRKADMAYLLERAAASGLELEFKVEKDNLRSRVRTVYVWTSSVPLAAAFIQEYLAFPSPYRARAVTKRVARERWHADGSEPASPVEPAGPPPAPSEEQCSFCGKRKSDVRHLVAGSCVYICNECVTLCNDVIGDDEQERVGVDPQVLQAIVRFARQLPSDVSDDKAVEAIDKMIAARMEELTLWSRARGRDRADAAMSNALLASLVSGGAAAIMGSYLAGTHPDLLHAWGKTSPTSANDAASGTKES